MDKLLYTYLKNYGKPFMVIFVDEKDKSKEALELLVEFKNQLSDEKLLMLQSGRTKKDSEKELAEAIGVIAHALPSVK